MSKNISSLNNPIMSKVNNIMQIMEPIVYGFKDQNGFNLIQNAEYYDKHFTEFYYLQTPAELLKSQCGVCWDQVELERFLFQKEQIPVKTYFICTYDNENIPSHTFLVFQNANKYYWFEHSWFEYRGIHEYLSLKELLLSVKEKFLLSNSYISNNDFTFIYEYQIPPKHISCSGFYQYIETQKLIKTNSPLYFYLLLSKQEDLNNNTHQFTKSPDNYLYLLRYPPYPELGKQTKNILQRSDIYRINLNDEEVMKNIKDINYGEKVNKEYYQNITSNQYFANYNDNLAIDYSHLNLVSISFNNDFYLNEFFEKINNFKEEISND